MISTRILSFFFSCSLLSGVAAAQNFITINVGAGWSLNTSSGPLFDSQAVNLTGSGSDFLNVNAFSDGGFDLVGNPPVNGNQCQANAQGQRSGPGSQQLSGSAAASTFTFASFTLPPGTTKNADATATCTPSGVLNQPPAQFLNMNLIAEMEFRTGVFGAPADHTILARAEVTPPTTSGKLGSVNRLVLTNSGSISPTYTAIPAFFYSQRADASANCTLKPNSSVLANTDVITTATINLYP